MELQTSLLFYFVSFDPANCYLVVDVVPCLLLFVTTVSINLKHYMGRFENMVLAS